MDEVKELSLIEVAADNYANQKGGREFGIVYRSFLKGSEYRQFEINKLKADNEVLLNALKEIIALFPPKPKLGISYDVIELATKAIKQVESK